MSREPILTLGDLEPVRPTVRVQRNAPDGWWQRFKHRHFDVLLRWFPVRYRWTSHIYELRIPSEFGLAQSARLQRISDEVGQLYEHADDPVKLARLLELLREFCKLVLVAPSSVVDALDVEQMTRLVLAFQLAVVGKRTPMPPTKKSQISETSSPGSPTTTTATAGSTG